MSIEIKVTPAINEGISNMQSAAGSVPKTFAQTLDGDNQLDMADEYNEIKKELDDLFTKFEQIFQQHLLATEEAIESYVDTDQQLADEIGAGS